MNTEPVSGRVPVLLFGLCGIWMVGLGLYFMFLRPPLLPEDYQYMGVSPSDLRSVLPGLESWTRHVFTVMGGFMIGAGILTMLVSVNPPFLRTKTAWSGLAWVGMFTVGVMSLTNFQIDSDFKWLLLIPCLLWLGGLLSLFFWLRSGSVPDLSRHSESSVYIPASPEKVFGFVDDPSCLASHMSQSSWMMGGGKMSLELDEGHGQKIGSRIAMSGKAFGIPLSLEEVVIERDPPNRKVWETISPPNLLVIGRYRMGFQIISEGSGSLLRVFIHYSLLDTWLGVLFGDIYARWCTKQMAADSRRHFRSAK
jgi:hypothetical protein